MNKLEDTREKLADIVNAFGKQMPEDAVELLQEVIQELKEVEVA